MSHAKRIEEVFSDVFVAGHKKLPYDAYKVIATAKLKPEQKQELRAEAERRTVAR